MFGYVLVNPQTLEEGEKQRFRACYCGLCRALKARYGDAGRLTLSNDMTFLSMLLSALYEPGGDAGRAPLPAASLKKRPYTQSAATDYAADMNILLAY